MKTISEYSIFVSELAKNRENRIFLNSDEEHGLIVYVNLLKSAKKQIRIFAGRLCEHIGNKPEFVEAISEFIENNGQVSILLNNYDEKIIVNSPLFKRLAYYISEKKKVKVDKKPKEKIPTDSIPKEIKPVALKPKAITPFALSPIAITPFAFLPI